MEFSTEEEVFDRARSWRFRVVYASMGTTTGAIVMAMLGKIPKTGPAYGFTCDILPSGIVVTTVRKNDKWMPMQPIGSTIAVRDNLRQLADHCKLDDEERSALFAEMQKWIRKDYRAVSTIE